MIRLIIFSAIIFASPLAFADSIRVGVLLPLSGVAKEYGVRAQNGIELAKEHDPSPIKLDLIYEDTKFSAAEGVKGYRSIMQRKDVLGVITAQSAISVPTQPLANSGKVLQLAIFTNTADYSVKGNTSFRVTPSSDDEAKFLCDQFKKDNIKRIVLLYFQNEYGVGMQKSLLNCFRGEIVFNSGFLPEEQNFASLITLALAKKPDAIFLAGLASHTASIAKELHLRSSSVPLYATRTVENSQFFPLLGNIDYPLFWSNFFYESEDLNKAYKERFGELPDSYAVEGYVAYQIISQILNSCRKDVECWLREINTPKETVLGTLSFNEYGDVIDMPHGLRTMRDGKFIWASRP
jgi:ABC-type branched-subunit amino acid transport system substrate-binding protein